MYKIYSVLFVLALGINSLIAQETFSIVAVDTATGEVGSAGASCIAGSIIISDLVPGVGAMNAQAWVCIPNVNLQTGINLMKQGFSPQAILDSVLADDKCFSQGFDTNYRQYGIVAIDSTNNMPSSVGFTGDSADNYKNHITGYNYAIQGNILLGPQILDSIEAGFVNTQGDLACKLMAALQGANVPGADSRCLPDGTSSKSAFIRIAKPGDILGLFYVNLNVNSVPFGVEPIDSLQVLFDNEFIDCDPPIGILEIAPDDIFKVYPNPANDKIYFYYNPATSQQSDRFTVTLYDLLGNLMISVEMNDVPTEVSRDDLVSGTYLYSISDGATKLYSGKLVIE